MAADFPATLATIQRVLPGDRQDAPGKEADLLHNQICDELEALQAKVGIDGSAIATTIDNKLTGKMDATASALGTLISAATAKATPGDLDAMALADASASNVVKLLSWANLKAAVAAFLRAGGLISGGTVATPKIIANSVDSIPDSAADQTVLVTCASTQASRIGAQSKPAGAAGSNSDPAAGSDSERGLPWSNDSAYPNNGIAHVSCVVGGYDHVCNQEAGTLVGGGHNFLQYNASGHGTIVGGSNHRNAGARGAIVGGLNNTINAASTYGAVIAGSGASVSANWSATISGENPIIKSGAYGSAIVCGRGNTIGTNAYYAAAVASQNGVIQDSHGYAIIFGRAPKSEASGALTIGVRPLVVNGDCQASIVTFGIRTTSATIASMTLADGSWSLGSVACAVSIVAQVVGVDEATGNSVMFTWTGVAKWDGSSTSSISDVGGTSSSSRNMTQIYDGIGCAAVALVAVDTGTPRIRVTGKAATNIKWCGRMDVCAVRV